MVSPGKRGWGPARNRSTRVFATVYRFDKEPLVLAGAEPTYGPGTGGPAALTRANFSKTLMQPSGRWSISLRRGDSEIWDEIRPGDWIGVWSSVNGQAYPGFLGNVDTVQRSKRTMEGGGTTEEWTVSGRDHGKVFETTNIWFDDYSNLGTNVGGKIIGNRMGWNPVGPPEDMLGNIIDAWIGQGESGIVGGGWVLPPGLEYLGEHFNSGLEYLFQPCRGQVFGNSNLFTPNPGTILHDIVGEFSNPLLNEVYYDLNEKKTALDPSKPVPGVILREKPFVNSADGDGGPWFYLPTVRIPPSAIGQSNLAVSDQERLNVLMLYANMMGLQQMDQWAAYPPSYNTTSASRYGLRKMELTTRFGSFGAGETGQNEGKKASGKPWIQEVAEWHGLLADWYAPNHRWLSGTISLPLLLPEARIGKRLVVSNEKESSEDPGQEQFYIEGVNWEWSFTQKGRTQLQVTRGFRGTDAELVQMVTEESEHYTRRTVRGVPGLQNVSVASLYNFAKAFEEGNANLPDSVE